MGTVARHLIWRVGLLLLLGGPGLATAREPLAPAEEAHLQLFNGVEQTVAALGETFTFWVELYASPSSEDQASALYEAFSGAPFSETVEDLEVVRSEVEREEARTGADSLAVVKIVRRFTLRSAQVGVRRIPAFRFAYGDSSYATLPYEVHVYKAEVGFFGARDAVIPIVAEYRQGERRYARIGSAFLIAPDAVVTSYHVVMDAQRVRLTLPDGRRFVTRRAWSIDPARDVAVLYVDPEVVRRAGLVPLRLAPPADAVKQLHEPSQDDDVVFTYGWPGGVQRSTAGIHYRNLLLQLHKVLWISTNPVRPGDSGGPMLDRHGRVIGVISSGTVLYPGYDVLREEVCVATDPRPALGQMLLAKRPRRLTAMLRDPEVATQPHAHALRLSSMLATRGPDLPDLDEALDAFEEAVDRVSYDAGLLFLQGSIYQMMGTQEQAVAAYRASLEAFEGHFPASYMLGLHYLRTRDHAEAARQFAHTRQYQPYRHLAAYGLAQSQIRRLRYPEAEAELRRVLRYDPTFAPALFGLAYCYLARQDEVRARQILVKLEQLSPAWAAHLKQVLRYPIFRPNVLEEMPLAPIPSLLPVP